jgi:hypothetical protein
MPSSRPTVRPGSYKHRTLKLYIRVLEVYPDTESARVRFEKTQRVTTLTFNAILAEYEPV